MRRQADCHSCRIRSKLIMLKLFIRRKYSIQLAGQDIFGEIRSVGSYLLDRQQNKGEDPPEGKFLS